MNGLPGVFMEPGTEIYRIETGYIRQLGDLQLFMEMGQDVISYFGQPWIRGRSTIP